MNFDPPVVIFTKKPPWIWSSNQSVPCVEKVCSRAQIAAFLYQAYTG